MSGIAASPHARAKTWPLRVSITSERRLSTSSSSFSSLIICNHSSSDRVLVKSSILAVDWASVPGVSATSVLDACRAYSRVLRVSMALSCVTCTHASIAVYTARGDEKTEAISLVSG